MINFFNFSSKSNHGGLFIKCEHPRFSVVSSFLYTYACTFSFLSENDRNMLVLIKESYDNIIVHYHLFLV